ncbi:hypothetical protein AZE42_11727 [Rhizopogon vesiculosus]|uniref:Uncharacterized protein n=1 Tax=Rhizopogon vesiculosus TaxID=180088 RepID=A0A1J8QV69_9AGAM|nr:hypothetical protein AZE42_11727 [Rhizopogon vesiculosus]
MLYNTVVSDTQSALGGRRRFVLESTTKVNNVSFGGASTMQTTCSIS